VAETSAMLIQQMIPPATMIPACGLLLLSSTARMNTLLARTRTFHSERLVAWREDAEPGSRAGRVRALRLEGLEHQTHRLIGRAALLRVTMLLLFAAIACNLLAMIAIAGRLLASPEHLWLETAGGGVFLLGVVCMLVAMVTSAVEVLRIIETVRYEHDRVDRLCREDPTTGGHGTARAGDLGTSDGEGMGL